MITTFVFDIGNVLSHFSFDAIGKAAEPFTDLPTSEIAEIVIKWSHPFCLGELSEETFAERCLNDLQFRGTADDLKTVYNAGFSTNETMRPVIDRLKETHQLYYLSDTNSWHLEHLLAHESLLAPFHGGTTSFEAQALKPDAAIYEFAVEKHGFSPEQAVFIDDREGNVRGAEAVGFTGIHYDPTDHGAFQTTLDKILD